MLGERLDVLVFGLDDRLEIDRRITLEPVVVGHAEPVCAGREHLLRRHTPPENAEPAGLAVVDQRQLHPLLGP